MSATIEPPAAAMSAQSTTGSSPAGRVHGEMRNSASANPSRTHSTSRAVGQQHIPPASMVYGTGRVCEVQWAVAPVAASFRDDAARAEFARRVLMVLVHRTVPEAEHAECFARIRGAAPAAMGVAALAFLLDDMAWRATLFGIDFFELLRSCA